MLRFAVTGWLHVAICRTIRFAAKQITTKSLTVYLCTHILHTYQMHTRERKMGKIDWLAEAKKAAVWSIGQLSKEDRKALDRAVRKGEIQKARAHWQMLASAKTVYFPLGVEISAHLLAN